MLRKFSLTLINATSFILAGKKGICPELYIDSWGIKKMDEAKTGLKNLIDVKMDDHKLENFEKEKYL